VRLRPTLAAALCGTTLLAATAVPTALASDKKVEPIRIQDNCDPKNFPPPLCAPNHKGNVGLQQLLAFITARPQHVLQERNALGWRFKPDDVGVKPGTVLHVTNQGGELHSFTEVTHGGFTGGCVDVLNAPFGLNRNPLCGNIDPNGPDFVPFLLQHGGVFPATPTSPAGELDVTVSGGGTHLFQCLVHPWMRTTVEVKSH
jgi:plastocyanin